MSTPTEDLQKLVDAILVDGVTEIESEEYRFTVSSGQRKQLEIYLSGGQLSSTRIDGTRTSELIETTLEKLQRYESLRNEYFGHTFNFEEVNGWIPVTDHNTAVDHLDVSPNQLLYAWKTPIDDHYVYVYRDTIDRIKAQHPITHNQSSVVYTSSSEKVVLLKALEFLQETNPHQVDYTKRKVEVAEEKFPEIEGVGGRTLRKLIRSDILSFPELLDNITKLSQDYQNPAEEQICHRIETGNTIENNEYVQELLAQMPEDDPIE